MMIMFKPKTILLPTDFSHYAQFALGYAVGMAKAYDARIHLLHVLDSALFTRGSGQGLWLTKTDADTLRESMQDHAKNRFDSIVEIIGSQGVEAEPHILMGNPAHEILETADRVEADLTVIATHGRTGVDHMVFGSVAERVVRESEMPVLTIKHPEHEFIDEQDLHIAIDRILYPTDFSEFSQQGLKFAESLCREFNAKLYLFHASEVPVVLPEFLPETAGSMGSDMQEDAERLMRQMADELEGIEVEVVASMGVPHRELAQAVVEKDVNLVVIPTHGRAGITRLLFGSVAERVVRTCRCPVLTMRPNEVGDAG